MTCCWPTDSVTLTTTICLPYCFHTTAINFLFLLLMIVNTCFCLKSLQYMSLLLRMIFPILHGVNPCHKFGLNLDIMSVRSLGLP